MRKDPISVMLLLITLFLGCVPSIAQDSGGYSFERAFELGMVDVSSDYWSRKDPQALYDALKSLHPGIVNRFGFLYGGPSSGWLQETQQIESAIHAATPRSLLGAALPEALRKGYSLRLVCKGKEIEFRAEDIVSNKVQVGDVNWIDISRPQSLLYYQCLAAAFVEMGFRLIHFEAPGLVIAHSTDQALALRYYSKIASALRLLGQKNQSKIYISGDVDLSRKIPLDAIYLPARFYHNDAFAIKYRNKIDRQNIGVGYSYVLSPLLINDAKSQTKFKAKIFFYVDNWDFEQDDLRRFMELDSENRRFLIKESVSTARKNGVAFSVPLEQCDGCVPLKYIGDNCEKRADGRSMYVAVLCGDIDVIKDSLAKIDDR